MSKETTGFEQEIHEGVYSKAQVNKWGGPTKNGRRAVYIAKTLAQFCHMKFLSRKKTDAHFQQWLEMSKETFGVKSNPVKVMKVAYKEIISCGTYEPTVDGGASGYPRFKYPDSDSTYDSS